LSENSGDCKDQDGEKGRCVVGAIKNYTDQLLDYGKNTQCKPLQPLFVPQFVLFISYPLTEKFLLNW